MSREPLVVLVKSADGSDSAELKKQPFGSGGSALSTTSLIRKYSHPTNTVLNSWFGEKANSVKKTVKETISMAINVALMEQNRYFTLKEDYIGQNKLNNVMNLVGALQGVGSSASQGMNIGSSLGPGGAAIGALIGAATGVAKQAISVENTLIEYKTQLNTVNMQTSFAESRASLVDGGRGTEN